MSVAVGGFGGMRAAGAPLSRGGSADPVAAYVNAAFPESLGAFGAPPKPRRVLGRDGTTYERRFL